MMSSKEPLSQQTRLLDVCVIGGGLSGLYVSQGLHDMQADWLLLDARSTLGGRLTNDGEFNEIDLGGAWIWPQHQPNIRELVRALPNIRTFQQPDDPSSTRIDGGAVQFIHEIAEKLPDDRILLNTPVTRCKLDDKMDKNELVVRIETANNQQSFLARRVVFAAPPKLVSKNITFKPALSKAKQAAMNASQTWMAGVTKIALVYPNRFWNLDYSNMSMHAGSGPAFQVYDSGTTNRKLAALTFFALVPANSPAAQDDSILAKQVADQMAKVWKYLNQPDFSEQAQSYTSYHVRRWPTEKYISENTKPTTINPHPSPVRHLAQEEWDGLLQFAGSETDLTSPGVMEGAIGAAKRVLKVLEGLLSSCQQRG